MTEIYQTVTRCTVAVKSKLTRHIFSCTISTIKTWLENKDHLGQNDRKLKPYKMITLFGLAI